MKYYIHLIGGTKFFFEGDLNDVNGQYIPNKSPVNNCFTTYTRNDNGWAWFGKRLVNVNNITFIERIGD